MSKKLSKKNIATNEKSEKFFLSIGERIWYNYYNPRNQKAFVAYSEAGESFALSLRFISPWKGRGKRQKFFCRN